MKQKLRYRHRTKGRGLAITWPGPLAPEDVAVRARYVGSGEHKALPIDASYAIEPAAHKRSDSSRCDPNITREQAEQVLREAIKLGNVSTEFQDNFPTSVWGRVGGQFYAARLINREAGHYKAWPIEDAELPVDRDRRLGAGSVDDV